MNEEKYGLMTAMSLVVGIVIGSGIFFKSDDILSAAGGNIFIVIAAFIFVGLGVMFGSLVMSRYAIDTDKEGGIFRYMQEVRGNKLGFYFGWFMILIYMPSLTATLMLVAADYLTTLLSIDKSILSITSIGLIIFFIILITNIVSEQAGPIVQKIATFIKLIPLILVPIAAIVIDHEVVHPTVGIDYQTDIFALLLAIAFSFDGWYIATAISHEVKDRKKNMPLALTGGIIIITIVYILYTVGMQQLLGTETIIVLGNESVSEASRIIFGNEMIMTLFVFISVYGGLNGMVLSFLKMPKSLVKNDLITDFGGFAKPSKYNGITKSTILVVILSTIFYTLIAILAINPESIFFGFGIGSLPIIWIYIFNTILILGIIPMAKEGKVGKQYITYALLSTLISLIIIVGSVLSGGFKYIIFSLIILFIGKFFYKEPNAN